MKASVKRALLGAAACCLAPLLLSCEDPKAEKEPSAPPARFEAVTKKASLSTKDLDGFCDIRDKGEFRLPKITGQTEPAGSRWVNIWATWCKSCVEEMPMIEKWKKAQGFQVLYVSADEEPEALASFLKSHPETPATATMDEPETVSAWMRELGLDEGAGLPLHVFVRADNSIACARAAAVSEHHLTLVASLLK